MIINEQTNFDILVEFMRKYELFTLEDRKDLMRIIKKMYLLDCAPIEEEYFNKTKYKVEEGGDD
jgi:hypothetical protein